MHGETIVFFILTSIHSQELISAHEPAAHWVLQRLMIAKKLYREKKCQKIKILPTRPELPGLRQSKGQINETSELGEQIKHQKSTETFCLVEFLMLSHRE